MLCAVLNVHGCRHIDCSSQPDNEEEIGKAMAEIFGDWIVNRPDVFVTARMQQAEPAEMQEAVEAILKRLQTKYVDLLLLPADHIEGSKNLEVGCSMVVMPADSTWLQESDLQMILHPIKSHGYIL